MKKYLFGLGAMLVGAGLMFIFTHAEVSAEEDKLKKIDTDCRVFVTQVGVPGEYCKIKDLTCVSSPNGISCVRGSMF